MPASVPNGAQLWLIRHGETEWSKSGRHTGTTDIALTSHGEREARALRTVLAATKPRLVLSSPRRRARATAELAGLRIDEIVDDLAEWDYGRYEGRSSSEIRAEVPDWTIFTHGAPGGESPDQVGARADRVLERAASALPEGPVICVAHGHISRVLGARWIGQPVLTGRNLLLDAAAPSLLGAQYGVPVLDQWNRPNPATSEGEPA
ncbi:MAG: histidine phosphatase family protein [Actinomycetota bacterium]|nr:histidine phosphatase family protein [Actinomycetota bacterium]